MVCSPLATVARFVEGRRYRPLRSAQSYPAIYAAGRFRSRPTWRRHAASWLPHCAEEGSHRGLADFRCQPAGVQRERCQRRLFQIGGGGREHLRRETPGQCQSAGVHAQCSPEPHLLHPVAEAGEHPCVPCRAPAAWPPANQYQWGACWQCRPPGVQAEAAIYDRPVPPSLPPVFATGVNESGHLLGVEVSGQ